jgi:transcriptional regulator with PAS, ATPase and Fis domain
LDQGFIVADADGYITEINQFYANFLGCDKNQAVGKHVTDLNINSRMHIVAKTGIPELYQIHKSLGKEMLVNRVPIFKEGQVVSVVGNVMFSDLGKLFEMTEGLKIPR